jgi:hypothetical protein
VTIVTTWAEWATAIQSAQPGAKIAIAGTIEIAPGQEVYLNVPDVTILAASPGSGLHGVATPAIPVCLVCLGADADGAIVKGLTLTGGADAPLEAAQGPPTENVTMKDNHVECVNGCSVHVFFHNAPNAVFTNNVLTGEPSFSAIQLQAFLTDAAHGAVVKDNWVEHGGPLGGIRIRNYFEPVVSNNIIVSAPSRGIITSSLGGTFKDNKILEVLSGPSCIDQGPGNTWKHNDAPVPSEPVGICGPTS